MKLWRASSSTPPSPLGGIALGRLVEAGAAVAGAAVVVEPGSEVEPGPGAWVVPSGLGGHVEILERLRGAVGEAEILVAINGLGPGAIGEIGEIFKNRQWVPMFDARNQDHVAYLEQLAWLRTRGHSFAVMSRSAEKLTLAAAAGADHLLVPAGGDVDWMAMARLGAVRQTGALRPISPTEVDHLTGIEASLSVRVAKKPGQVLVKNDLDIALTTERGIAPYLGDRVLGLTLRYGIEPGEPLGFGHLMGAGDGGNDDA